MAFCSFLCLCIAILRHQQIAICVLGKINPRKKAGKIMIMYNKCNWPGKNNM